MAAVSANRRIERNIHEKRKQGQKQDCKRDFNRIANLANGPVNFFSDAFVHGLYYTVASFSLSSVGKQAE